MPELPEVETVRRKLLQHARGLVVSRVQVHQPGIIGRARGEAPRRCSPRRLLSGCEIVDCHRLGKQLALEAADGRLLRAQLGMTGQFLALPPRPRKSDPPHLHVTWHLRRPDEERSSLRLCFRDVRRFGSIWPACSREQLEETWSSLGPDALTIRSASLRAALARTRRPTKAALLDQERLAGVGNIYADESLFATGIHPLTPANTLSPESCTTLAAAIRRILRSAVRLGGSTIRDYLDVDGVTGYFQTSHKVYGRAGEPCAKCRCPLVGIRVIGRATVFCPRCQGKAVRG
jgi:formamidopyrimidine-DNA glycosylase